MTRHEKKPKSKQKRMRDQGKHNYEGGERAQSKTKRDPREEDEKENEDTMSREEMIYDWVTIFLTSVYNISFYLRA